MNGHESSLVRLAREPETWPGATPGRVAKDERSEFALGKAHQLLRRLECRVAESRSCIVGRLAVTLRSHHGQLGAFGRKLPDFLTQLSEQLYREQLALVQLIAGLQIQLDRLRPAGPAAQAREPAKGPETAADGHRR